MTAHLEVCKFLTSLDCSGLDPEREQILEAAIAIENRKFNPDIADQLSLSVFGVRAEEYTRLMSETSQLSCCCLLLKERIAIVESEIGEFPKQYEKDCQIETELKKEFVRTDNEIAILTQTVAKAKLVWEESQKALIDKDPGPKPTEKKAAQKWLKKREAFQRVAHELRASECKNKKLWESAVQSLHEANCKRECLRDRLEKISVKITNPTQKIEELNNER